MWYMFCAGPNDREGRYLGSFPSLDAARRVVEDFAEGVGKKLVLRQNETGVQLTVKDHAPTFEALAGAIVYTISREKRNPVMKPVEFAPGGKPLKPGEKLPPRYLKYLKVEP